MESEFSISFIDENSSTVLFVGTSRKQYLFDIIFLSFAFGAGSYTFFATNFLNQVRNFSVLSYGVMWLAYILISVLYANAIAKFLLVEELSVSGHDGKLVAGKKLPFSPLLINKRRHDVKKVFAKITVKKLIYEFNTDCQSFDRGTSHVSSTIILESKRKCMPNICVLRTAGDIENVEAIGRKLGNILGLSVKRLEEVRRG